MLNTWQALLVCDYADRGLCCQPELNVARRCLLPCLTAGKCYSVQLGQVAEMLLMPCRDGRHLQVRGNATSLALVWGSCSRLMVAKRLLRSQAYATGMLGC